MSNFNLTFGASANVSLLSAIDIVDSATVSMIAYFDGSDGEQ